MKKILSFLLSAVLVFSLFAVPVSAASASFSLTGSGSVTVGSKVTVGVRLSGSEKIGSWRFSLSYDPSVLEYVSGADSGGGGAVLFSDSSDGVSSYSRNVVFRARKVGSSSLSISGGQVVSFDSASNMSISGASKTVTVVEAPTLSAENNLSSLTLSSGSLSPDFNPQTTAYSLSVPFEVRSLVFSATPKDSKASVAVSGADALVVGANTVSIVVTAQNGAKKTYTVTVTREESELSGVTANIEDKTYQIAYDPEGLQTPAGYEMTTATLGDKKILAFASPEKNVLVSFLYTEAVEDGAWYVFNDEKDLFTPYVSLQGQAIGFVVLTPGEDVTVPQGFQVETITIGEQNVSVYAGKDSKENGIYLIYGFAANKEVGFYYYDSNLGTFSTYFMADSSAFKEANKEIDSLEKALKNAETKTEFYLIILLAVGIVAVLLLIALIISLATRKAKSKKKVEETPIMMEEETPLVMAQPDPLPEFVEPSPVKKRKARRTIEKVVSVEEESVSEENEMTWPSFEEKELSLSETEENNSEE